MTRYLVRLLACLILCSTFTACVTQGKPGTPLPPPNKEVGKKWPPEVGEFVDAVQTMFVGGKPVPSEVEVERALKATFAPTKLPLGAYVEAENTIPSWSLGETNNLSWSRYTKMMPHLDGRQSITLNLRVDTKHYCINPYDFAIYTGQRFMPTPGDGYGSHELPPEPPRDAQGKPYLLDYVWGMFSRAPNRLYLGTGLGKIRLSDDNRCVEFFEINAFFKAPDDYQGRRMP